MMVSLIAIALALRQKLLALVHFPERCSRPQSRVSAARLVNEWYSIQFARCMASHPNQRNGASEWMLILRKRMGNRALLSLQHPHRKTAPGHRTDRTVPCP